MTATQPGTSAIPTTPKAFESLKIDFDQAVKKASLQTYRNALDVGFRYLEDEADKHELYTLKGLFASNKGKDDLCDKVQSYLVTNFKWKYYRYTDQVNKKLQESITGNLTKYEARNILMLIRCHEISKEVLSKPTKERLEETRDLYEYINRQRNKKTLHELYKEMPDIKASRIKDIYTGKRNFSFRSELNRIINANLYLLTYDHERFTSVEKHGRIFNAFTNLSKIYRENEFPFQLKEYDIKSANPQIIDKIFKWSNYTNVYRSLMKARNITRDDAKELFNSTVNKHKLTRSQAEKVYKDAGYSSEQAKQLSALTAGVEKGAFYREMAKHEADIINSFTNANFENRNFIRLHDAVYFEPEFNEIDNPEANADFSAEILPKANISLNLKQNINKIVLTAPGLNTFVTKQYFDKAKAKVIYKGSRFTFYDRDFRLLSANFNINAPIYENEGKRTPTDREFIERIKQLYRTLLFLNEGSDVKKIFKRCIEAMAEQEGISFNTAYIYTIMERWHFKPDGGKQYIKQRNWTYFGGKLGRYQFQSLYYSELGECKQKADNEKLKQDIRKLIEGLKNDDIYFIDKKNYKRSISTITHALIEEVNEVVGIKTKKQSEVYNKVVQEFATPIKDFLLGVTKSCTSQRELSKHLNVNRRHLAMVISIQQRKEHIIDQLEKALHNLDNVATAPEKLFAQPKEQKKVKPIRPDKAFAEVEHQHALREWNKLNKYQKNIYLNQYVNGFLSWKAQNYNQQRATA